MMKSQQHVVPCELKVNSEPISASLKDMFFCLHQDLDLLKSDGSQQQEKTGQNSIS